MKKIYKVLSAAALGALFATGVVATASCGNNDKTSEKTSTLDSAIKMLEVSITNNGDKISSGFSLPATITEYGKTYSVTWTSSDTSLLVFSSATKDDGTQYCKADINPKAYNDTDGISYDTVSFSAVLTDPDSKETKTSSTFRVRVLRSVSKSVIFDRWINGSTLQDSYDVEGYVLAKLGYNSSYKEANLIVWDNEAQGAYFIYQCYLDQDVYNALEGGEAVKVTGATRNPYNGLIESKYGATATVDTKATKLDISTLTRDITSLVRDGSKEALESLMYYQSSKVSLKNVKVTSNSEVTTTDGKYDTTMATVSTVSVGSNTIDVALYQGFTAFSADSTKTLVEALHAKKDSYVDLEGYLSWNSDGPVFIITSVSDITDSTEPAEDKILSDINAAKANVKTTYASTPDPITLPTTGTNGSALSYTVEGEGASLASNVLTLTVGSEKSTVKLNITGSLEGKEVSETVTIQLGVTDQDIAQMVADAYSFDDITNVVNRITLEAKEETYNSTYTWTVKDSADGVAEIKDGKLILIATSTAKSPVITLTVTKGEASYSRDITLSVPAYTLTSVTNVAQGKDDAGKDLTTGKTYVTVEGYISAIDSQGTATYISATQDTTKSVQVYKIYDNYGTQVTDLTSKYGVGTKVVINGRYKLYNGTYELEQSVILSYDVNGAQASVNVGKAADLFEATYTTSTEVTLPEGISATVKSGTSAVVNGNKVTITPTAADETVVVTLSSTVNGTTITSDISFLTTTKIIVTAIPNGKYNVEDVAITDKLGITDSNITITNAQNDASTQTFLSAANGQIRLYNDKSNGNGGSLTITAASSAKIAYIIVNLSSDSKAVTVKNSTSTITEDSSTTGKYVVDGNTVTIQNCDKSGQVRIVSIIIAYVNVD